jgi:hypothetical protein
MGEGNEVGGKEWNITGKMLINVEAGDGPVQVSKKNFFFLVIHYGIPVASHLIRKGHADDPTSSTRMLCSGSLVDCGERGCVLSFPFTHNILQFLYT